ncbi:MAG TPA: hypothetical protein VMJ70_04375 [Candidatus Sulfotelmatobacter sp.]|nr:hypothetical protein [Candidatus Sulfotelmatobacter sp.]
MSRLPRALAVPMLLAPGLLTLFMGSLRTGFLSDDYVFLEQARSQPLLHWLFRLDALGNYWRPLSRQIYFEALSPIAGGNPLVFHLANFLLFLLALGLLADLLSTFASGAAMVAGVLYFALLPLHGVNLIWVSCSQDLMALAGALGTLAFWRRDRRGWALLCWLGAIASKEAALPLPLALLAWDLAIRRRPLREALRHVAAFAAVGAVWIGATLAIRSRAGLPSPLRFSPVGLFATYLRMAQSLLGLEHPAGFVRSLLRSPPPIVPLVLLAAGAWWAAAPARRGSADDGRAAGPTEALAPAPRSSAGFGILWLLALGIVTWPVVYSWSGYYYTLSAVGAAWLVALAARRLDRIAAALLLLVLLPWHQAGTRPPVFSIVYPPAGGWTSHLTPYFFSRGAALADTLSSQLRVREPRPAPGTRFFFATLPPWAGFQMGNGPLIRVMYRDPSLESYYYSQFSDSTADAHPCRFYYWDGARLLPLYGGARDPYFQVGCDLLLMDRPQGAVHAFTRALETGGRREDNFYWLGWAQLWSGRRDQAERAWAEFGAHDDTLTFNTCFRAVRGALYQRADTVEARRLLMNSIRTGIGQPGPHAILGELLWARGGEDARYGLLELKVATWLNARDILAARELIFGLYQVRLDEQARLELTRLQETYPDWRNDSLTVNLVKLLEARAPRGGDVASFEQEDSGP